jgi:hypothetical protein
MALTIHGEAVNFTLTNSGSGNTTGHTSTGDPGYMALNNNFWWATGGYGVQVGAGSSLAFRWLHGGGNYFGGVGEAASPTDKSQILFGFHMLNTVVGGVGSNRWWIYESGVAVYNTSQGVAGGSDWLEIRVGQDGVVEYYINDVLKYTSTVPPATVKAYNLRPLIVGGYYASWDVTYETQPSASGSADVRRASYGKMSAISVGIVPAGIPTEGQLLPRLTGFGAGSSGGGVFSNSRYANAVLQREPQSYWRLGELAAATAAADEMARVSGTFENVSKEQTSLIVSDTEANTAALFNGSNSRIICGAPTSLQLQSFTLMMLHRTPASFATAYRLIDFDSSDSWSFGRGYHWAFGTDGKHTLSIGNAGAYSGAPSSVLSPSTTYHLAATYDGSTQKVYTNGALDGSVALAGPVSYVNASLFALGYVYFGGNFIRYGNGVFDEIAIFPYAMSAANIEALYKSAFNIP